MKIFGIPLDLGGLVALVGLVAGAFLFLLNIYTTNLSQAQQLSTLTNDTNELKVGYQFIQRSLGRIEGKLGINATDQPGWHH